ncbi:MAG TPA: hypothetical protein VKK79_13900 [Candidatus Lokiarchaeia archaeon]|nr:hypothetical protein [Candidatus Lokiarchaeia archaeon]
MTVSPSTLVNGISACVVMFIGGSMGVQFLVRYFREKKGLMPFASFTGFTLVGLYLGPFATFWSLMFTGSNISFILYGQLSYAITPIAIMNAMWLGFTIFSPDKRKLALYIYLATAVPYYILLFGFPVFMFVQNTSCGSVSSEDCLSALNGTGQMADISLTSGLLALNAFYILSVILILTWGFYNLRQKISGEEQKRVTFLMLGFLFFGIAAMMENTLGAFGDIAKIVARVVMATCAVLNYMGFSYKLSRKEKIIREISKIQVE